jgi:protein-S-isoprenylcysteine O-methyltransferase Ste14
MNFYCIIGSLIFLAFYGSYFTKMYKQRKAGIKTDQMARGKKSTRTFLVERYLKFFTFITALSQLLSIAVYSYLKLIIESEIVRDLGLLLALIGVLVFVSAMYEMKDSWRAGIDENQKTEFITSGIYRFSRNPAFVGFDLMYIGMALAFSNYLNIIFALCSVAMLHLQILQEEKFLPVVFGKAYYNYKIKTRRYL